MCWCRSTPTIRRSTGCRSFYTREGVYLDRSTLAGWVGAPSELLKPLVEAGRDHVLSATKLHADDTPVSVLAPGNGKTKTGRLWTYVRDDRPSGDTTALAVWFAYSPDRKGERPREHLKLYQGALQADAYAGFQISTKEERSTAAQRTSGRPSGRPGQGLCSTACAPGYKPRSPGSRRSQTPRLRSATRSRAGERSPAMSTTASLRLTTTPQNERCASSRSGARTSSSPVQTREGNAPPPYTRCSAPPSSTASTPKAISTTSSNALPTTPPARSTTCCPGI